MSQIEKKLRRAVETWQQNIDTGVLSDRREEALDYMGANIICEAFVNLVLPKAETFNFSEIQYDKVEQEHHVGLAFYRAGFFVPPFENFVFTATIPGDPHMPKETADLSGRNMPTPADFDRKTIVATTDSAVMTPLLRLVSKTFFPPNVILEEGYIFVAVIMDTMLGAAVTSFFVIQRQNGDSANGKIVVVWTPNSEPETTDPVFFFGLWSILNTKGIELKRRGPTREQHAALLAKGNTTGRPITYVGVKQYLEAREEASRMASSGTHASPRPHLRRGHIRQWRGRPVAVRPCIVNSTVGDVIKRDTYVVHHQGDHL